MDFKQLSSFDWHSLKKYTSPHAADDLNAFLEKLPQNTNQTLLVITGIAWAAAGACGLFTTLKMQEFTELRATIQEMEAVKPSVPTIANKAVSSQDVAVFVQRSEDIYKGLTFRAKGSVIKIEAKSTAQFGQFREAIGHIQNGGVGWRVNIESICVGRECGKKPLEASLKINRIDVQAAG